jgi:hypothetical protein
MIRRKFIFIFCVVCLGYHAVLAQAGKNVGAPADSAYNRITDDFTTTLKNYQLSYHAACDSLNKLESTAVHDRDSIILAGGDAREIQDRLDSLQIGIVGLNNNFNYKVNELKSQTSIQLELLPRTENRELKTQLFKNDINKVSFTDGALVVPENFGWSGNELSTMPSMQNIGEVAPQFDELPTSLFENRPVDVAGASGLQDANAELEKVTNNVQRLTDKGAMKELAKEQVQEVLVDHFADSKEVLTSAINEISDLKQKYSSVSSMHDLPKLPGNSMKGKPFTERIVPGLLLQYQKLNDARSIDINPYIGYRLSGKFTAGAGWNQRFIWDRYRISRAALSRVYGPRFYFDTRIGMAFIAHIETEWMNTYVPDRWGGSSDAGGYEWVSSTMIGLKKEYRIYKNLRGTALMQYNLYNPYYKAPYMDRMSSRVGFEYRIAASKK